MVGGFESRDWYQIGTAFGNLFGTRHGIRFDMNMILVADAYKSGARLV
jgi:hypothetical protein